MTTLPKTKLLDPEEIWYPARCTRSEMIERLEGHGWTLKGTTHTEGRPMLVITGPFPGTCNIPLPPNENEDHGPALDDVYMVLGYILESHMGLSGRA